MPKEENDIHHKSVQIKHRPSFAMAKQEPSESFHSETHVFDPIEYVRAYYSGPDNFPCPQEKEVVEWTVDKIQRMFDGGVSIFVILSNYFCDYFNFLNNYMEGSGSATIK